MTPQEETHQQEILTLAHHTYEKGLRTYAFFKIHDSVTSQDLVQDTFMKAWIYLAKGGEIELMKAFLYHVLNNLIVDEYRRRKSNSLDLLIEKGFEPGASDSESILDIIDGSSAMLLISHLPVVYRKIMGMKYIQNLTLTEISLITGQTKNTIAVQTHRGLEKLKVLYAHQ